MSLSIVLGFLFGEYLNSDWGFTFATTGLLLSISDVSENITLRLKSLVIHILIIISIAITTTITSSYPKLIYFYLLIFVGVISYFKYFLNFQNNIQLVALLAFTFYVSKHFDLDKIASLSLSLIISGCFYLTVVLISYFLYKLFSKFKFSYVFYIDEAHVNNTNLALENKIKHVYDNFKVNELENRPLFLSHPFRLYISLCIAYFLMLNYDLKLGYWILITVVTLHRPLSKATFKRMFQRIIGTVIGLFLISLIMYYVNTKVEFYIIMLIVSWLIFVTIHHDYLVAVVFITMLVIMLISIKDVFSTDILVTRLADTLVGVGIVIFVQLLSFWGRKIYDKRKI